MPSPRLTTYGFEAEYEVGAPALIQRLAADGYAADGTLHSYHCDCGNCEFNNEQAFRGQTDSSCSGEIISDVFGNDDDNTDTGYWPVQLMEVLADRAVEVDAEPGLRSSFHVHVGIEALNPRERADILWQFIRWEPVLQRIAGARWQDQRADMNTTVRDCTRHAFQDYTDRSYTGSTFSEYIPERDTLMHLLGAQSQADRHSNLNISARRTPTWEFRLWNATRSAWRMELFTGLSVALVDPAVVHNLSTYEPPQRRHRPASGVDSIAEAVGLAGHSRTAELVMRQAEYLDNQAESAPSLLTVL